MVLNVYSKISTLRRSRDTRYTFDDFFLKMQLYGYFWSLNMITIFKFFQKALNTEKRFQNQNSSITSYPMRQVFFIYLYLFVLCFMFFVVISALRGLMVLHWDSYGTKAGGPGSRPRLGNRFFGSKRTFFDFFKRFI